MASLSRLRRALRVDFSPDPESLMPPVGASKLVACNPAKRMEWRSNLFTPTPLCKGTAIAGKCQRFISFTRRGFRTLPPKMSGRQWRRRLGSMDTAGPSLQFCHISLQAVSDCHKIISTCCTVAESHRRHEGSSRWDKLRRRAFQEPTTTNRRLAKSNSQPCLADSLRSSSALRAIWESRATPRFHEASPSPPG